MMQTPKQRSPMRHPNRSTDCSVRNQGYIQQSWSQYSKVAKRPNCLPVRLYLLNQQLPDYTYYI